MTGPQTQAVEQLSKQMDCEIGYVLFRPSVRMVDSTVFTRREDAQEVIDRSVCANDMRVAPIIISKK